MRLIDADRLLDRCKFYHLPNGDLAVPIIDVQHAPTVEAPDINVGNIDAISRTQAIDAFETAAKGGASIEDIKLIFENLPSVQPDTTTNDSIPAETGKNDGDGTSGDCISRQRSVDTLRKMQTYKLFAGDDMLLIDQVEAQTELMMLPPAEPKRKKMTNKEWVDFLSEQFAVSRTSAREMLHGLMRWKAEDNFKKQFSGGRNESRRRENISGKQKSQRCIAL